MMVNFEEFSPVSERRRRDIETVTISKKGMLTLNEKAVDALDRPDAIVFLWAADERIIGLRRATAGDRNSYVVRSYANNPQSSLRKYSVGGTLFCKRYNLLADKTRRYRARLVGDVLRIDLKEPPLVEWGVWNERSVAATGPLSGSGEQP